MADNVTLRVRSAAFTSGQQTKPARTSANQNNAANGASAASVIHT